MSYNTQRTYNPESKTEIARWCVIASKINPEKNDPFFAGRMYLRFIKHQDDFHAFKMETIQKIRMMSKEDKETLERCIYESSAIVLSEMDRVEIYHAKAG